MDSNIIEVEAYMASERVVNRKFRYVSQGMLINFCNKQDFAIPKTFEWMAESSIKFLPMEFVSLFYKRNTLDGQMESIISIIKMALQRNKSQLLWSYEQLSSFLHTYFPFNLIAYRMLFFKLLCDEDSMCADSRSYPVENILLNYKQKYKYLEESVDELVCHSAFLAKYEILKKAILRIHLFLYIKYNFQPFVNKRHAHILEWLEDNIAKGEANPESEMVFYMDYPDSARWPSENLRDFKETHSLLLSLIG